MRQVETGLIITGDSKGGVKAVKATRQELDKLGKSKKRGSRHAKDYTKSTRQMTSATKLFASAVAAVGLGNLARGMIETIKQTEKLKASLVTMTGSLEGAEGAFAALTEFAKTTPFTLDQSVTAFVRMKSLGLAPTESALKSFGNTAAAMGKDLTQMIEAVADATTGEFERLKEFGIKARQNGDEVSFTFQGITTTVGNNAQEINGYLESIGNNQFAGAMEEQMGRLPGLLSNLQDSFEGFARDIGGAGFTDLLEGSITRLSGIISENSKSWAANMRLAFDIASIHVKQFLDIIGPGVEIIKNFFESAEIAEKFGDAIAFVGDAILKLPINMQAVIGIVIGEVAKLAAETEAFFSLMGENSSHFVETVWLSIKQIIASAIDWILNQASELLQKLSNAAKKLGFDDIAKSIGDASAQLKFLGNNEERIAQQIAKSNKVHKENVKAINARKKATKSAAQDFINATLKERDARLKQIETEIKVAETMRDSRAETEESAKSLDEFAGEMVTVAETSDDTAEEMAKSWEEATKRIDSAFADAWAGAFDSFDDFADQIKNAFKKLLGELIHQATTKKILIHLGLGGGGGSGGGITGGGGGDILSTVLGGGGATGGGGLEGFLGSPGGSFAATVAAGYAGSKLGNSAGKALFGKEPESNIGASIGATIGAVVGGPIGAAIGGFFGGLADSLFGGDGKKRFQVGISTDPGVETFQQVGRETSASGLSFSAQNLRGGEEGAQAAKSLLDGFLFIDEVLTASLNSLGATADLAGRTIGAASQGKHGESNLDGFFGSAAFNKVDVAELEQAPTEFVVAWLNAVQGALTQEIKRILPLVKRDAEELVGTVAAIANIGELLSVDVFDLVEKASRTLFEAYHSQLQATIDLAGAYDGSLESLSRYEEAVVLQGNVSLALAAQITDVFNAIEQIFGDTRRSIQESLMTEEELYNARRAEVSALFGELGNAVDPARIAQISQDINRLTSEAFNLLDEQQGAQLAGGFLSFLDETEALAAGRLDLATADVNSGSGQVGAAFDSTVTSLEAAAEAQRAAAEAQFEANRELYEMLQGFGNFFGGFSQGSFVRDDERLFQFTEVNA